MVLPLIGSLVGSALAGTGALGGIAAGLSPLTAGAIGSGLGAFAQTGDLEEGVKTGIGSFLGGKVLGSAFGAASQAGSPAVGDAAAVAPLSGQGAMGDAGGKLIDIKSASFTPTGTEKALTGLPAVGKAAMNYATTGESIGSALGRSLVPRSAPSIEIGDEDQLTEEDLYGVPDDSGVTFGTGPLTSIERDFGFGANYASGGYLGNYYRPSMMGQTVEMQEGGIVSLAAQDAMMDGMDDMGEMPNEKEIIMDAVDAIQDPEPDEEDQVALAMFVRTFGEDALKDLVDSVERGDFEGLSEMNEGMIQGPGDAMDDLVPATNTSNGEDILLSGEEFIVPGDVVSGLGNGSSSAGADELYDMMDRVREARTGTTEQPPKISAGGMLPA